MPQDILEHYQGAEADLRFENNLLQQKIAELELDFTDATQSRREGQQKVYVYEAEILKLHAENSNLQMKLVSTQTPISCLSNMNKGVQSLCYHSHRWRWACCELSCSLNFPTWRTKLNRRVKFQDRFVRGGIEGGKKAAYALRAAVAEQCDQTYDTEIQAKVVANLGGLSRAMARDGAIEHPSDLRDFALGLTQAKASFDFIDVGHGKEKADSKIKGTYLVAESPLSGVFY